MNYVSHTRLHLLIVPLPSGAVFFQTRTEGKKQSLTVGWSIKEKDPGLKDIVCQAYTEEPLNKVATLVLGASRCVFKQS